MYAKGLFPEIVRLRPEQAVICFLWPKSKNIRSPHCFGNDAYLYCLDVFDTLHSEWGNTFNDFVHGLDSDLTAQTAQKMQCAFELI